MCILQRTSLSYIFSNYLEAKERSLYLTAAVTFPIQTYFKQSNHSDHLNVGE